MKILVTGAAGLIGRHLLASIDAMHDVTAVTRRPWSEATRAHVIQADLGSPSFIDRLPASIDTVIHLAQSDAYRDFPARAADIFNVNVASTARLLEWARAAGARRFILASAGGADRAAQSPLTFYLATRRSAELLAAGYQPYFNVVTLRFHFVYGTGQAPTMLMPRLVASIRNGSPIALAGPDGLRLTPTHVSDAVMAITSALRIDGSHVIDVAGPEVLSLKAIASIIGRKIGRDPVFEVNGQPPSDIIANLELMRRLLGEPRRRFESGVDDLLG